MRDQPVTKIISLTGALNAFTAQLVVYNNANNNNNTKSLSRIYKENSSAQKPIPNDDISSREYTQ